MTALKNLGVSDRLIACVDGVTGFPEAIRTAYPQAKVQLCIAHPVRAALEYVTDTDSRTAAADLKAMYTSATVPEAEQQLRKFAEVWGDEHPTIVRQWRRRWPDLTAMLEIPAGIRNATDTTNAIESVNGVIRVIRKFARNRKHDPSAESALKLVYLATHEATKKWTMPIVGWKAALNHFAIVFEGRIPQDAMV